jgi:hypothetical protein
MYYLGELRQEDLEFQGSLGNTVRPLQTNKKMYRWCNVRTKRDPRGCLGQPLILTE